VARPRRRSDGREVEFTARLRAGRAPGAGLRVAGPCASLEHATVRWRVGGWEVRDPGSCTGTWVDGAALEGGRAAAVDLGSRIAFGDPADAWEVVEAGPPSVHAEQVGGGEVVAGRDGRLVLPGPERPEASVHRARDGRWVAEVDDGLPAEVDDGAAVAAGGGGATRSRRCSRARRPCRPCPRSTP
jgi:hypothetical protein